LGEVLGLGRGLPSFFYGPKSFGWIGGGSKGLRRNRGRGQKAGYLESRDDCDEEMRIFPRLESIQSTHLGKRRMQFDSGWGIVGIVDFKRGLSI